MTYLLRHHATPFTLIYSVKVLRPTPHKIGHFRDVPQANLLAWYWKTKPNTKVCIHQSKDMYYATQNKHKKTKARFSRLIWHPAWKQRGPIVILVLHKFVTYLLRHLPTYLQPRHPHEANILYAQNQAP